MVRFKDFDFDILLIDNREVSRNTTYNLLLYAGYKVDTAMHGKEGILKLQENKFSYKLVITEMIMPFASGFEVIESVKGNSKIPVMVLSSVNDENTITSIYNLDADEFIKKPFIISDFMQKVKRLISIINNSVVIGTSLTQEKVVVQPPKKSAKSNAVKTPTKVSAPKKAVSKTVNKKDKEVKPSPPKAKSTKTLSVNSKAPTKVKSVKNKENVVEQKTPKVKKASSKEQLTKDLKVNDLKTRTKNIKKIEHSEIELKPTRREKSN